MNTRLSFWACSYIYYFSLGKYSKYIFLIAALNGLVRIDELWEILDMLCTWNVWTNKKPSHKDIHKAIFIEVILGSLDAYEIQTCMRFSTNHIKHKNNSSNQCIEHSCVSGMMRIEEYIEFTNACLLNYVGIKKERGTNYRLFLISRPTDLWLGGHNWDKNHCVNPLAEKV